jgi:hypothetical protein
VIGSLDEVVERCIAGPSTTKRRSRLGRDPRVHVRQFAATGTSGFLKADVAPTECENGAERYDHEQ